MVALTKLQNNLFMIKILQVHNYYQYPGGEDIVLINEYELLLSKGSSVKQYIKSNKEISTTVLLKKGNYFYELHFRN